MAPLAQRRFALSSLVAGAVVLFAASAGATNRARLVYLRGAGAESCPDEAGVRDAIFALLGYDPFSSWAEDTLVAEIQRDVPAGFVATIKLVDPRNVTRGERRMQTRGACGDLVSNMALTISLAIDPMGAAGKGEPTDGPPAEKTVDVTDSPRDDTAGTSVSSSPEPPPSALADTTPLHVVWAVGAGAIAAIGVAPGPNVGATVFGEARIRDVSVGLEGRADAASSSSVTGPLGSDSRVSSSLLAGTGRVCGYTGGVFGCGLFTLGSLRATGADVPTPGEMRTLYASAGARLGYEMPLGAWLSVRACVEGAVVLTRYALTISGHEVFRYSPIAGNLGLSLVAHL